jgi:hypothetical protein
VNELIIGARLVFTGGREGWIRATLTALGVGIGVAVLLLAAAVPGALQARNDRGAARADDGGDLVKGANTLLVAYVDTEFRGTPVRGRLMQPEGPQAPVPPGLTALPRPGEVAVSPALKRLLDSPDGQRLFAPRFGDARVVATIGDAGLTGPSELVFIRGADNLDPGRSGRIDRFGVVDASSEGTRPLLIVLVVIMIVVLLLPLAVFLAAAVRFGGEGRDRRLAALRLLGADPAMTRRIAAGEATAAALLGLGVGGLLFVLGRQIAPLVTLWNISVFAADVRPSLLLVVLIVVAVPTVAVAVSIVALRRAVIEPLGVTRRAANAKRRLWWRILLPALGVALLWPLIGGVRDEVSSRSQYQIALGAALLLIGTVTLLPWVIDVAVRRLGGGPVPWELAVRRLQADSATSARLVNGIAVAVAGAIGLQMLFAAAQAQATTFTSHDTTRAQAQIYASVPASVAMSARQRLTGQPGITSVLVTMSPAVSGQRSADDPPEPSLMIGDCATLAEIATLPHCADGDVFLATENGDGVTDPPIRPGAKVSLTQRQTWALPATLPNVSSRPTPTGGLYVGVLATPGALPGGAAALANLDRVDVMAYISVDPADPDVFERVRNAAGQMDPTANVMTLHETNRLRQFVDIQRGLYIGMVVTLLLIAGSMLVGVVEQLRERRRLLAMLVAVGTRRATLSWSVVYQALVPLLLGLVLATGIGVGLGLVLQRMTGVSLAVDWAVIGVATGIATVAVMASTAVSLPVLWRLARPDGIRTE